MHQLRIKDNSGINKGEFSDVYHVTKRVVDITLEQLEREGVFVFPETVGEAEDLSKDQMVLQSVDDKYRSSNIMGFIGYGDERLVIESRFAESNDFFLTYLLSKVIEIPNVIDLQMDYDQNNRVFGYLLFLFPMLLKSAMRKGVYKTYVRNYYNDANVKGSIDIARHISRNVPFRGNIAYSQREYSFDNDLLELIRHTIEFIRQKTYGKAILEKAYEEVQMVVETTRSYNIRDRKKIVDLNKKNIISHAYYHEYRKLQHLCILILQHEKHQIGMGARQIYGILFDGAWLWEEYINTLIAEVFYHPTNKNGKGVQHLFAKNIGPIYPDFISKEVERRIIADAKYKSQGKIGNQDYLQVLAYMFRFDARTAYYLYPERGEGEPKTLKLNKGSTYEGNVTAREDICLIKLGLKIPFGAQSYEEFVHEIHKSEDVFRRELFSS